MKKHALIIGNSDYPGESYLKNPINDAEDLANALKDVGFSVSLVLNASNENMDFALAAFAEAINDSDIGLFYFAGHGVQVKGENFLVSIDSKTSNETLLKHSATSLDKVLEFMEDANNEINIVILDACRDNPFERSWRRSGTKRGFASVFAPKGTLISFSTSPGQFALDGSGKNSPFAYALLTHLTTQYLSIEDMFKRVRESLMANTSGQQISWEHTSLTGNFQFNPGSFISVSTGYDDAVVADTGFEAENSSIENIIKELKNYNYYAQNSAVELIDRLETKSQKKSLVFLLGRNLLQAAIGGSNRAKSFITNTHNIDRFDNNGANDLLNGIFFEMYFDSLGRLRYNNFKAKLVDELFKNYVNGDYLNTVNFIKDQLLPFSNDIYIMPQLPLKTICFNIVFENESDENGFRDLIGIYFEGRNILTFVEKKSEFIGSNYKDFCTDISLRYAIPRLYIKFTNNVAKDNIRKIAIPQKFQLSKYLGK